MMEQTGVMDQLVSLFSGDVKSFRNRKITFSGPCADALFHIPFNENVKTRPSERLSPA